MRPRGEEAGGEREAERDRARDQDLALDQGDVVVDLPERLGEDRDPGRVARAGSAAATSAERVPSIDSTPAGSPPAAARRADPEAGGDRAPLRLGVGDHERVSCPSLGDAEDRHPGGRRLRIRLTSGAELGLGEARAHRLRQPRRARGCPGPASRLIFCAVRFDSSWGTT